MSQDASKPKVVPTIVNITPETEFDEAIRRKYESTQKKRRKQDLEVFRHLPEDKK